jgi:hypothetical protein
VFFADRIKLDVGLAIGLCHGGADPDTNTGTRASASAATGTDTCRNACADPAASSCCDAHRIGCASGSD